MPEPAASATADPVPATDPTPASAGTQQAADTPASEPMIPKSRFDEINNELKRLKRADEDRTKAQQQADDDRAKQQGEFQKLAESHESKARQLETDLKAERDARQADRVRYDVTVTSHKLGIVDPEAAFALMDRTAIEFGDDGAPTNTEALLTKLLEAKPYLKGTTANGQAVPATPKANGSDKQFSEQEQRDLQQREARRYAMRF